MEKTEVIINKDLEPFVNCVMVREERAASGEINIPLHADGYPGIMFQQSEQGFYLLPQKKRLSELFLYGQTLKPVTLSVKGPFKFIVVQLYPFASRYLLGVHPKELNDDCFDLLQLSHVNIRHFTDQLALSESLPQQ